MSTESVYDQITELVRTRDIIICSGSGGVGKTTTAAVLGMEAARLGRRAVVVTIDPAKRLADALGLGELGIGNQPRSIEGRWPGSLAAVMLDTTELSAREIVERGLSIAADICVFTNHNLVIEELDCDA